MVNEKLDVKRLLQSNNVLCDTNYLLILCGCSGSGKSYFERELVANYPQYFNKLPQITTRMKRNDKDNGYYFVDGKIYNYMEDVLIARLQNFNGNKYGTLPTFDKQKINTVIASYDAIVDIFERIDREKLCIVPILVLLDIDSSNLTEDGIRTDRDSSFLEKERTELFHTYEKYKSECVFSAVYKYEDYGRFIIATDIMKI